MSKPVTLRYVGPFDYLDVPILGRQGEAPHFAHCADCAADVELVDHEHTELVGEHTPGSGPLAQGEKFETTPEIADRLLEQAENFELVEPKARRQQPAADTTEKG